MKRAVSISLGSSRRDKVVTVTLKDEPISVERIGTDGDAREAKRLFSDLDGQVDAFGVGGVDIYLRLGNREYPLRAAHRLIENVRQTPVVDGRGLKHTLERRVFELLSPLAPGVPRFRCAFVPVAADRLGLAEAVSEVADEVVIGDLMIALGIPIPIHGIRAYYKLAKILFPIVSYFPLRLLFYGSSAGTEPKYHRYWQSADLIAGDYLFLRKYLPQDLEGKTIVTNTTTAENVRLLYERGAKCIITTTPRYDGRSFGTNLTEAMLTAYAGQGRPLSDDELNTLIDELDLRPTLQVLNA